MDTQFEQKVKEWAGPAVGDIPSSGLGAPCPTCGKPMYIEMKEGFFCDDFCGLDNASEGASA